MHIVHFQIFDDFKYSNFLEAEEYVPLVSRIEERCLIFEQ